MGLDLLGNLELCWLVGAYIGVSLWDSTLRFLNQSILEIYDSCINIPFNIYLVCRKFKEVNFFFSLSTFVALLILIIPVSLGATGHNDH